MRPFLKNPSILERKPKLKICTNHLHFPRTMRWLRVFPYKLDELRTRQPPTKKEEPTPVET